MRASLAESGLFKYAGGERLLDAIARRGEALHYAGAAGSIIGGAVGAVASGVAGASTCAVSVGLGCALGAAGVAGSVAQYSDGLEHLNTGFVSTEGQHVLDSFRPGTHPGDVSLGSRFGGYVVSSAAELVLERVGGKAIGAAVHAVDGKKGGERVGSDVPKETGSTPAQLVSDLGSNYRVVTPRGVGSAEGPLPLGYTSVSRWASPLDFAVPEKSINTAGTPEWGQIFQPAQSSPIYNVKIHVPQGIKIPGITE